MCAGAGLVGSILLLLSPSLGAFLLVAAAFSAEASTFNSLTRGGEFRGR